MRGGVLPDLPPQAIQSNQKNDKWKKACLDSLERIGLNQFKDNIKFNDYFRMSKGQISFSELSEMIPQLREVENILDDYEIPTTIKHYDLLGIILKYLESILVDTKDKFYPTNVDENAVNDREREQTRLMQSFFLEQWNKELTIKLINSGINPEKTDFKSEDEKQAFIQELEQRKESLTPPEIKKHLQTEWKPQAVEWAECTLEADIYKQGLKETNRECVKNYLHTGRCFKHYFVGYDDYKIESWSPINTFFSQTIDTKYPQYGEYIGRIHFYTPSDFINKKGHNFDEITKQKILNNGRGVNSSDTFGKKGSFESDFKNNFSKTSFVPHANYHDHNFLLNLEDELGVPMSSKTIYKKDGTTETTSDFLPRRKSHNNNVQRYATYLRDDLNLRSDMICVTEAYWRSYKRVGFLTYITPNGSIDSEIVTDELLKDFIKEYEIKELRNVSLQDLEKKREPNTIVWDYVPEIWSGEKASTSITELEEDLYYNIKPLEFQIKGNSNVFDLQLPVAGLIDNNPSDKIMPFQYGYNIVMNQKFNLLEKEIGVFFLFDAQFLPNDIKTYGDTESSLFKMLEIVKGTGLFGVDGSKSNLKGGSAFNQFAVQDLSLSNQIAAKQAQAEYFKQKAWEQFGVNAQILTGEPTKYQTATGVNQMMQTTRSQTDYLYEAFSEFEARALEIHINVAQYAQGTGKDISVEYTKSDLTKAFLKFTDPNFSLRRFGILFISDSKKRQELEQLKQYILSQNTMDMDTLEIAGIISTDSMVSLIANAKIERARKEIQIEKQRVHELQIQEQQAAMQGKAELRRWVLEEITNTKDRVNKILEEQINAYGRAADKDANEESTRMIKEATDLSLKATLMEKDFAHKEKQLEQIQQEQKDKYKQKESELSLKTKDLEIKRQKLDNDRYIAEINKN